MKHAPVGIVVFACAMGLSACGATLVQPFRNSPEFRSNGHAAAITEPLAPAPLAYVTPPAAAPSAYRPGGSNGASSDR